MKEQFIHINTYGDKKYHRDKAMTILHREDGPAVECEDGTKYWYINGKRHREDGPAVEHADGDKFWFLDGKRHRTDGPAVEYADGDKFWLINGHDLTEEEFNARKNSCNGKIIEVDGKKYKLMEL
jgi:hypothetical protein